MNKSLLPLYLSIVLAFAAHAADSVRFDPVPNASKVRIDGTSSIHDWQAEGKLIGGHLEAGPSFPTEPGQAVAPGKVEAKAYAFIPVRSLKSIEKDGKPYSDSMDNIMYEKLLMTANPRIIYELRELELKSAPPTAGGPYTCEAKGALVVAGMTNAITMPVNVTPLGNKKIKIAGNKTVKMTDFAIKPPAPAIALGLIKTGDEVKLSFEWVVAEKQTPAK